MGAVTRGEESRLRRADDRVEDTSGWEAVESFSQTLSWLGMSGAKFLQAPQRQLDQPGQQQSRSGGSSRRPHLGQRPGLLGKVAPRLPPLVENRQNSLR